MSERAILLDAGNVLVSFQARTDVLRGIARAFGGDENAVEMVFRKPKPGESAAAEQIYAELDSGACSVSDVWCRFIQASGISHKTLPYPVFLALWSHHLQPIPNMMVLLRRLQERYPLIMVTNGDYDGFRYFSARLTGFEGLRFAMMFNSAECRCVKPKLLAHAYAYMSEHDIDPERSVFIDDVERYTIAAATEFAIPGICFNAMQEEVTKLKSELRKLGFDTE